MTIDFINETISFEDVYEANTAADFSGSAIESGGSVQPGVSVYVRTKRQTARLPVPRPR